MAQERDQSGLTERIRLCAKAVGSGDVLATRAGIPRRTLENYLSGRSEPKATALLGIAKSAGFSLDWLIAGEGPMRRDEPGPPPASQDIAAPATTSLDGRLLGLCFEGVRATYRDANARIDDRAAGELAARLYADVIAATEGDTDLDTARPVLRMGLRALRRELDARPSDTVSSKHSA